MNKKVGLVLGGGPYTLAEIEAIEQLHNHDIKPCVLSGTSMGAVYCVLLSVGYSTKDIKKLLSQYKITQLFTLSFGKGHLIQSKNLAKLISKICEEKGFKNIEDLPIKTCICVTDDKTNSPIFLTKGSIFEAIMASTATRYVKKVVVKDEQIKKQILAQTKGAYTINDDIVLKDGCFTANVPYEGIDLLTDDVDYKICIEVPIKYQESYEHKPEVLKMMENNILRKNRFIFDNEGIFIEVDEEYKIFNHSKQDEQNAKIYARKLLNDKYLNKLEEDLSLNSTGINEY